MGVPRVYSPTPLFLLPNLTKKIKPCAIIPSFIGPNFKGSSLFNKGRGGLAFLLSALKEGFPKKSVVLIPAYGAQSLVFATLKAGLTPRLVDIDPKNLFYSLTDFEKKLDDQVLTAFFAYSWGLFPRIPELEKFQSLCRKKDIFWIEDFATSYPISSEYQAFFNNYSPIVFFSYGKTKMMSLMDGGVFALNKNFFSPEVCERILGFSKPTSKKNWIKIFTQNFAYHVYASSLGFSLLNFFRLTSTERPPTDSSVQIEILGDAWERSFSQILKTESISTQYRNFIANEYGKKLENKFQASLESGSRFPLLIPSSGARDTLNILLNKNSIGSSLGYIKCIYDFPLLKEHFPNIGPQDFPGSELVKNQLLTLPCNLKVKRTGVNIVCDVINRSIL